MEKKFYWLIWIVIGVFLLLIAGITHNYFYHMKETNCKSIMATLDVSTEDVTDCKKFYNYPFWEFELSYWLLWGFAHLVVGLALLFTREMIDDDGW